MSSRQKLLWGIAVGTILLGIGGAIARGYWGVSHDCETWVSSHGYHLVHNESFGSKASGWVWQFAIFAAGALPAVGLIAYFGRR